MAAYVHPPIGLRLVAIPMIGIELAIHAVLVPSHLAEVPYIGALFLVATLALAAVLSMLLETSPHSRNAWLLGAVTCAAMFVGFLVSRTFGLPDYHESWLSDNALGVASIPPELVFIACACRVLRP